MGDAVGDDEEGGALGAQDSLHVLVARGGVEFESDAGHGGKL